MKKNITIAIDGPSGAGKSSVARILASKLNMIYLDTGAMYRAVGLKVFRKGISVTEGEKIEEIIRDIDLEIRHSEEGQRIILDGEDVSQAIREHHISKMASDVSALPFVRLKLVELQRSISAKADSILDGRDIGTYVLPNATFKFYLTADLKVRAKRRYLELINKGASADLDTIEKDIAIRDYNDTNRAFAPLKKAEDAIEVDSTTLTIDETIDLILKHILGKQ